MNWWRWGVTGVLAAGLVVVLALPRSVGPGSLAAHESPVLPALATQVKAAPADGAVRVVEQGFTQRDIKAELTLTPGYGPGNPEPYKPVYSAFTLANTSTVDVMAAAVVKVTYYDAKNRAVGDQESNYTYTGPVLPGSSGTFAGFLSIDSVTVTRMTVAVTSAKWVPLATTTDYYAALSARAVKVPPAAVPGLTTVTYTAGNGLAKPIMVLGIVVFRDAAGKLLGAQANDSIGGDTLVLPPGDSVGSTTFRTWFPPGTDRGKLQVTLRPGYAASDR